jgi:thiol-disulfide isomerase/thioredoxin
MKKSTQILIIVSALSLLTIGIVTANVLKKDDMMKKTESSSLKKDMATDVMKKAEDETMKKNDTVSNLVENPNANTATIPEEKTIPNEATSQNPTSKQVSPTPQPQIAPSQEKIPQATPVAKAEGKYVDYKPELLSNADNNPVVLFFHASWCPTCKATEKSIADNQDAFKKTGITLLKIDYDTATDLKKQYGVTSQSTFVKVDATGKQLKKGAGLTTVDALNTFAVN